MCRLFSFCCFFAACLCQPVHAQLNVFACEPEWAALAVELGGEMVEVSSATTAMQDPHHIQAKPSLIAKMRNADLLLCTGAELEIGWLPLLLQKSGNPAIQPGAPGWFMATDYVVLVDKPLAVDRREGDVHLAGNPHIHTAPANLLKVAEALVKRLVVLQPMHRQVFEQNYQRLYESFAAAEKRWQSDVANLKGVKITTYHTYWVYLEQWLGLRRIATLEAKPGVPPTSGHLATLVERVNTEQPRWIVYEAYQDSQAAEWLSARTRVPILPLPATVSNWQQSGALLRWYDSLISALIQP